jgi:hypothetical protein
MAITLLKQSLKIEKWAMMQSKHWSRIAIREVASHIKG